MTVGDTVNPATGLRMRANPDTTRAHKYTVYALCGTTVVELDPDLIIT